MGKINLERLVKDIKDRGLTAYEISKTTPLSEDGINKILRGDSKNPRQTTLLILQDYLEGKYDNNPSEDPKEVKTESGFEDIVAQKVLKEFHPMLAEVFKSHDGIKKEVAKLILDNDDLLDDVEELKEETINLKNEIISLKKVILELHKLMT